ncbi:MAG: gas vesicle protein GvpG [Candidatus Nanopelagicales bacterium]|nr:gas vesicle protein GvpG [Candidatus Nanopelagicales bacterium]MDZ4249145.1 gas vesicle protein GvpG [Candidatus Nanopelagicales bacterium]MDZ7578943.1 gas vesicle protein GvpG [Candidatus Nanopelagicales bacterium]
MNPLLGLLTLPITLPPKGLLWVFEKVQEEAERELNDPVKLRGDLMELQRRAAAGEMSDEAYEKAEAVILDRLDNIEARQQAERAASVAEAPAAAPRHRKAVRKRPPRRRRVNTRGTSV